MDRSNLFLILILILVGACVPSPPTATTTAQPDPTTTPTTPDVPAVSPTVAPDGELALASCPPLAGDVLNQIRTIESQVSQLRGLMAQRPVAHRLLTTEELRLRVSDDFLTQDSTQVAEADAIVFSVLGLLPESLDLRQLYADLLDEQVAGFYDFDRDEMVVVCDGEFNGVARLTYTHEFVHALQDQRFPVEQDLAYLPSACEGDSQRCAATQALLEGDAALLQEQWLRRFAPTGDLADVARFFSSYSMPIFESAPAFIQSDLTFPYLEGLFFVRSLYLKDGWVTVDAAYDNPPQSTEQILHPERYPQDVPVRLEIPALSSWMDSGWEASHKDVLGEWVLRKMLALHLPINSASVAAEGWGGDFVLLLEKPGADQQALIQVIQWDTMRDAHEFTAAYKAYGRERFGESQRSSTTFAEWVTEGTGVLLERQSNQTLIMYGPSGELAALRDAIALPVRTVP